jgi:molybdate transport system substrate-binding protein
MKFFCVFIWLCLLLSQPSFAQEKIIVFAAASLSNALTEVSQQFEQDSGIQVRHAFSASSTLAKQIENGAPADIFISADQLWMDYLVATSPIIKQSRAPLLSNQLSLVAPLGEKLKVQFNSNFALPQAFKGKLCTGETDSVPIGIYAKQALSYFNWWKPLQGRIVGTQDVRGALNFVQRGECIGIVYKTDAISSNTLQWLGDFPEYSHEKIIYPAAQVSNQPAASAYLQYLNSDKAKMIFKRYGFQVF